MIHSNLASLSSFLQRDRLMSAKEKMKIRSAELQAVVSSAGKLLCSGNLEEVKFQTNSRILRRLSPNQKVLLYELLYMLAKEGTNNWFNLLFLDVQEFYDKIGLTQNPRYFYLRNLGDNNFLYLIDERLWNKRTRTNYFRLLCQPIYNEDKKKIYNDLYEVLEDIIQKFKCHFIFKNRPKKKVFRKGYNDHGSLGSEFSKSLRQQSQDIFIREEIEKREKERNDTLQLLFGFTSYI